MPFAMEPLQAHTGLSTNATSPRDGAPSKQVLSPGRNANTRGACAYGAAGNDKHGHQAAHSLNRHLRNPHALTPLILFMGFIGASLRYALELAFPANGGLPFATLIINIFGCFVLEIINAYVGRRMHLPPALVKSMGVGLVGAFTTISAFSTECLTFMQNGAWGLAALYIALTLVTTFLASLAGHAFVTMLEARHLHHLEARREAIHQRHAAMRERRSRENDKGGDAQ